MWGNSWCPKPTTARWHRCAMLPASWAEACMKSKSHFCFILTTGRHCEAKLYVQCVFCCHPSRVHQHSPAGLVIVQVEWKWMKKKTNVVHLILTKVCSSNNHFCLLQKFWLSLGTTVTAAHAIHTSITKHNMYVLTHSIAKAFCCSPCSLCFLPGDGNDNLVTCEFTLKLLQILTPN